MPNKERGYTIRLDSNECERLEALARALGVKRSDVLRSLIQRAVVAPAVCLTEETEVGVIK